MKNIMIRLETIVNIELKNQLKIELTHLGSISALLQAKLQVQLPPNHQSYYTNSLLCHYSKANQRNVIKEFMENIPEGGDGGWVGGQC